MNRSNQQESVGQNGSCVRLRGNNDVRNAARRKSHLTTFFNSIFVGRCVGTVILVDGTILDTHADKVQLQSFGETLSRVIRL